MARKTFEIAPVVTTVNTLLASPEFSAEERRGAYLILERILLDSGNYRGFSYLPTELNEDGTILRKDYDSTRRRYSL